MSLRTSTPIDALAAPSGDGEVLIWPAADQLTPMIEQNRRLIASSRAKLLDRPLSEWGAASRGAPLIYTGHQPLFFHPGVWAKNVAATSLAARAGGSAIFLAVDSDAPERLALEWPRMIEDRYERAIAQVFPSLQERCYEQFPSFSSSDRDAFAAQIDSLMTRDAGTPLAAFLSAFGQSERHSNKSDFVSRWANGMSAIDRAIGAASPMIDRVSDRFAVDRATCDLAAIGFVAHVLLHAGSFAGAYNGALTDYRSARGIRGDRHPIPDLLVTPEKIELPFWVLGSKTRQRLFVSNDSSTDHTVRLWSGHDALGAISRDRLLRDPKKALSEGLGAPQIRPRALALMIYVRLLACDLFIHGIGGAKYDQIADEVIRRFFESEPPAYACMSATLRLPLRRHPVTREDVLVCQRRRRDLQYNPQRYLDGHVDDPRLSAMIAERTAAITRSDHLRAEEPANHSARRNAFHAIHQANRKLIANANNLQARLDQEAIRVSLALSQNSIVDNRDWFLGLYPIAKLVELRLLIDGMRF